MKIKNMITIITLTAVCMVGCNGKETVDSDVSTTEATPYFAEKDLKSVGETIDLDGIGISYTMIDCLFTKDYHDYGDFYEYDYIKALSEYSDESGKMKDPDQSWMFFTLDIANTSNEVQEINISNFAILGINERYEILDSTFGEVLSFDKGAPFVTIEWAKKVFQPDQMIRIRFAAIINDKEIAEFKNENLALLYYMGGLNLIRGNTKAYSIRWEVPVKTD